MSGLRTLSCWFNRGQGGGILKKLRLMLSQQSTTIQSSSHYLGTHDQPAQVSTLHCVIQTSHPKAGLGCTACSMMQLAAAE